MENRTEKEIIIRAGKQIAQYALNTTKNIFSLYKKAGKIALNEGKNLMSETIRLALDNKKNVVNTSSQAYKDTMEVIREKRNAEKNEAVKNRAETTIIVE